VLRHAGTGAAVELCLSYGPESVSLSVVDDGGGLVPAGRLLAAQAGHGLVGMRERISVHGGHFAAGPRPDGGWGVTATVPARAS